MGRFATAVNCMDGRVQLPVIEYIKDKYGADFIDMVTEAAPIKILTNDAPAHFAVQSIKRRVEISIERHDSKLVAIVGHYDCAGNPVDEKVQLKQIREAVEVVRSWNPDIRVTGLWVNHRWQVEEVG